MEIGWFLFGFFLFVTLIFVAIAFFLPEWVGITGKKAKEILKEHKSEVSTSELSTSDAASSAHLPESKNQ